MARLSRREAAEFLLRDVPTDLPEIEKWVKSRPKYEALLLDHFKCRKHQLAYEIYQYVKARA